MTHPMTRRIAAIATLLLLLGAGCPAAVPAGPAPAEPATETTPTASNRLDLSDRGLTALPKSVLEMTSLHELDVSGNRIGGALPAEIGRLQALRVLDASGNAMTGVPAEIGRLSELRVLDLSENDLTGLPYELANLKKLERLDLRGNDVSAADLDVIRRGIPQATVLVDGE